MRLTDNMCLSVKGIDETLVYEYNSPSLLYVYAASLPAATAKKKKEKKNVFTLFVGTMLTFEDYNNDPRHRLFSWK